MINKILAYMFDFLTCNIVFFDVVNIKGIKYDFFDYNLCHSVLRCITNVKYTPKGGVIIAQGEKCYRNIGELDNLLSESNKVGLHIFDNSDKVISYKALYKQGNEMTEFEIKPSS